MDIDSIKQIGAVTGAVTAFGVLFIVLWRLFRTITVLTEGIMGKPAVTDYAGETVEKAVPSIQARVGKLEEILIGVADANERLLFLETWRVEHERFSQDLVRRLLDTYPKVEVPPRDTIE